MTINLDEDEENREWLAVGRYPFPEEIDTPEKIRKYLRERGTTVEEFKNTVRYKANEDDFEVLQEL